MVKYRYPVKQKVEYIQPHEYVYGGYEIGSGGDISCATCNEDVSHPSHVKKNKD